MPKKKKIPPHNFHSILLASKPAWAFCLHFHVNYSVFFTDGLVSIRMNSSRWSSFRDIRDTRRLHSRIKGETSGIARIRYNKQTMGDEIGYVQKSEKSGTSRAMRCTLLEFDSIETFEAPLCFVSFCPFLVYLVLDSVK